MARSNLTIAIAPFDVDETLPGDSDFINQHPSNARTMRDVIESWISVEHDTFGRHAIGRGTTVARDAITDWVVGALWINTDNTPNEFEFTVSIDPDVWVTLGSITLLDTLVTGPGTVTDSNIVLFDGTTGFLTKEATEGILTTVSQVDAEAGTATDRRIWTAERARESAEANSAYRQVQHTVKTDTFSLVNPTTWTDITGLSVSITPRDTDNEIEGEVTVSLGILTNTRVYFRVLRGASTVVSPVGDAASSRTQVMSSDFNDSTTALQTHTFKFFDTPAAASAQTYKVQMFNAAAGTSYINRTNSDTDSAATPRGASSITVREVNV